jgi:hypothetical protein
MISRAVIDADIQTKASNANVPATRLALIMTLSIEPIGKFDIPIRRRQDCCPTK